MTKKIYIVLLLCLCAFGVQAQYTVQTLPNPRLTDANAYVANPDGVLEQSEVNMLTILSDSLYKATGVEMVFVIVNSIGYEDAFDFSLDLFNTWGIGDKEKNRGVLVFMSMEYHDIQIRTGGGVEGLLPDAICSDIIQEMIPYFREGNYFQGLVEGGLDIFNTLTTDKALAELLLGYRAEPVTESPFKGLSITALIVLLLTLIGFYSTPKCPKCGKREPKCVKNVVQRATYSAAGSGIAHYTCWRCAHEWQTPYTIPKKTPPSSSSSSSGGYYRGGSSSGGSFGGGRSFGGGAGGKW